ncbi:MAG: phosphohistidine phosphatase SixA [Candidatus Acidiferrales bacterium]
MILYIVRHGIAVDKTDPKAPPDPERPLTAKGIQKTRAAALGLKELGVKPDVLITSPYVRAAQTAEIFAEALGFPTAKVRVTDSLKPPASPADFIKEISHLKGKEVMCFGHAPHLDQLIAQMVGARAVFTELKKAGVACLERTGTHSTWHMISILTPKALRQLA